MRCRTRAPPTTARRWCFTTSSRSGVRHEQGEVMSEHTRDVFRAGLLAATALPYFETVAQAFDLNVAPDLWVSLEFPLVTATRITIGYPACFREAGTVFVHVIGRSGLGDAAAIHEAELIRTY